MTGVLAKDMKTDRKSWGLRGGRGGREWIRGGGLRGSRDGGSGGFRGGRTTEVVAASEEVAVVVVSGVTVMGGEGWFEGQFQ